MANAGLQTSSHELLVPAWMSASAPPQWQCMPMYVGTVTDQLRACGLLHTDQALLQGTASNCIVTSPMHPKMAY